MRIVVVSRIFAPEVSAASGLLLSWAKEFRDRGHDVTVVTSTPPPGMDSADVDATEGIRVRRAPVVRDRQQYVRGYVSYLSFDVPLFFRLLFSRRADLYVVEPPPTTVAVVRLVGALRRTPYVVDAADLWSDAAALATSNRLVLRALRAVERFALRGSRRNLVVAQVYADRMKEIGIHAPATVVGFGADTGTFRYQPAPPSPAPLFIYAGTYSEWHGAGIFLEAFARIVDSVPGARLQYVGNGQERDLLRARAHELGLSSAVEVLAPVPPAELVPMLSRATVSLSSLKPDGYHYAFTTKIYSSLAAGCPVIYAGEGPTAPFMRSVENADAGVAVPYDVDAVAQAMLEASRNPLSPARRKRLSEWAHARFSLAAVATKVVDASLGVLDNRISSPSPKDPL